MATEIEGIAIDVIDNNYFYDRFPSYLRKRKINNKDWPLVIAHIVLRKNEKIKNSVYYLITDNINKLVEDVENFTNLLTILIQNDYDIGQVRYSISHINIDLEKLTILYKKMNQSENSTVKECSGTILGLIGRKSPEVLFQKMEKINDLEESEKTVFNDALLMSSFRPFRNPNFRLPEDAFNYIIQSIHSENDNISIAGLCMCIRSFDLDNRFNTILKEYVVESDITKRNFLNAIFYERLFSDRKTEICLLIECSKTNSGDVTKLAFSAFAVRLHDRYIEMKDLQDLQRVTLDLIKKWHKHPDFQHLSESSSLLERITMVDPNYTFDFLLDWIINEQDDLVAHQFYYPKLFYNFFKSYEEQLIAFVERLASYDKKFDKIVDGIFQELIFELRLDFDSQFKLHNETTGRDLNSYLNVCQIKDQLDLLYAEQLDDVPVRITKALEIIEEYQLPSTDANYKNLEHKKKDLINTLEFFERKIMLLSKSLSFLVLHSQKRNLNHLKLTRDFRSGKIQPVMTSCEILRTEIFNKKRAEIDYSAIRDKLAFFPNIEKYFGYRWLEKKWQEGYPYHHILTWLSKAKSPKEIYQLLSDCDKETDPIQKEIRIQDLRPNIRSLAWLHSIDKWLAYFDHGNEKGKKEIISSLQSDDHLFQFLSQLELANKLQQHGFNVSLEVPSINKRKIDIIASKNGISIICELATLGTYSELKYSSFSSNIPDRPKSIMLDKLSKQVIDYAKDRPSQPILIMFNMSNAIDADLDGVQRALKGGKVDNIVANRGTEISRYVTFERDPEFLKNENGGKLTGIVQFTDEFVGLNKYLSGGIILNATADVKLEDQMILELNEALFRKPMIGQPESLKD